MQGQDLGNIDYFFIASIFFDNSSDFSQVPLPWFHTGRRQNLDFVVTVMEFVWDYI